MNAEQASKRLMRRPTRRIYGEGCQRPGSERREHRLASAGVLATACVQEGGISNTGSPVGGAHAPTGNPRGPAWAGRVAERPVVVRRPGKSRRSKGASVREQRMEGGRTMETGVDLQAPDSVRRLQTALHAKAKGDPAFRFYTLSDKVWREDVLRAAWRAVRRNGGVCGVDGETFEHIKEQGVDRWLGRLAKELRENTYRPCAVRQVLIPKKQPGKFRPLGIPCIRDRVAQTAAMLVLTPIFEADLQAEQYAYRAGRSAQRRGASRASAGELGPAGDRGCRPVELLRRNSACRTDAVHRAARKRRADAGLDQEVAGNGRGGGRWQGRRASHEPCAPGEERDAARCPDLPAVQ